MATKKMNFEESVLLVLDVFALDQEVTIDEAKEYLKQKISFLDLSVEVPLSPIEKFSLTGFIVRMAEVGLLVAMNGRDADRSKKYILSPQGLYQRENLRKIITESIA